jgi:hypothetical protein
MYVAFYLQRCGIHSRRGTHLCRGLRAGFVLESYCTSNGHPFQKCCNPTIAKGHNGRDRMVVGFTTTCAISTANVVCSNPAHALDFTLCNKGCQCLAAGR